MKKTWLAGLLSFLIPGIGQFYIGKIISGIAFIILYVGCVLLPTILGEEMWWIGLALAPLIWIINVIHAIFSSIKTNKLVAEA
ncbi:hypothetical protein ACFFGV_07695 [Pontibacillus salicampi]|uniref:TM2 domain-containing protein n=1 Tax=Pontibacillus salicampi TaxID=1449801 RepID=A0ABV6LM39_9BACI